MGVENEKITVQYTSARDYCRCCDRDLDEPVVSEVRDFDFYISSLKEDNDWNLYDEEDELDDVVDEYIFNKVSFYAVSGDERIKFLGDGKDKILQYIKNNLLSK